MLDNFVLAFTMSEVQTRLAGLDISAPDCMTPLAKRKTQVWPLNRNIHDNNVFDY